MKLITYRDGGDLVPGIVIDDKVVPVESLADRVPGAGGLDSVVGILEAGAEVWSALAGAAGEVLDSAVPLVDVELSVPVPHPKKIICIGLNYQGSRRTRRARTSSGAPDAAASSPVLFAKWEEFASSATKVRVLIPRESTETDGLGGRARSGDRAQGDSGESLRGMLFPMSADTRLSTTSYPRSTAGRPLSGPPGKACDTFGPCGPWVVTADEIPDPQETSECRPESTARLCRTPIPRPAVPVIA